MQVLTAWSRYIRVARVQILWKDWKELLEGMGRMEGIWKEFWKEFLVGMEGNVICFLPSLLDL